MRKPRVLLIAAMLSITCGYRHFRRYCGPSNFSGRRRSLLVAASCLLVSVCTISENALAQKVKVGYDKSVDFSRYKTYTLQQPPTPPNRPILYASIAGSIKNELEAKGLASVEKEGDLTLIATGGLDYGLPSATNVTSDSDPRGQAPQVDVLLWAGFKPPPGSAGKSLPDGTLELTFVDRATNKAVWSGIVLQKLDPAKKEQSLQRIGTAINKLLMEFPSKK